MAELITPGLRATGQATTGQAAISGQITSSGTYLDPLLRALAGGGDQDAVVHGDQRMTYAQAHEKVLRMAGALLRCGLRRGDGVAIFVGNRPESVVLELATHLIGCRLVFVIPEPGQGELRGFIDQADARAFVFDPGFGPRAQELAGQVRVAQVLSLGPSEAGTDLLPLMEQARPVLPGVAIGQDDIVTVMYTGGTTGRSKLVTHGHLYYDVIALSARRRGAGNPGPRRPLVCTLVTHSSGHVSTITGLLTGATMLLNDDFDAGQALATIERERADAISLTPPMLYEMLDHPACPARGDSTLTGIFYGGAPIAPARLRQAIERFGPVLRQSYGLTEAPFITMIEPGEVDPDRPETLRTCGRALPTMELEVRDDRGSQVPAGQVGEVYTRGLMMMTGYWGDPERTGAALRDGWLRTGDLGYLDARGYLYLVDRRKDVIVTGTGSDNVYSRLLDDFLATLPGVHQAAAVGVPDDRWGEAVHVFVVPEPGAALSVAELTGRVVDALGPVYEPQGITFVPALPWTAVGKIDKKALRVRHAAARSA
jgi:fatty-acyl-CoA synthase